MTDPFSTIGGFDDNFDIAHASLEQQFARLDEEIGDMGGEEHEQESPELPSDSEADDMSKPTTPEVMDFDAYFAEDDEEKEEEADDEEEKETSDKKRRKKHRNADSLFTNAEDDEDNDDGEDDEEDADEKDTVDKKRRRKHKNEYSFYGEEEEEKEDDEEKEEKEEAEDEKKAETESKRRKCKALDACLAVATKTARADGTMDKGLEAFINDAGLLDGVASVATESFGLFDDLVSPSARSSNMLQNLEKAAFEASQDLKDHYLRMSAGL